MKVYHGGTEIIKLPSVSEGRVGLDFGQGFYVTDRQQQAESWADRMARIRMGKGIVNIYEFDLLVAKTEYLYKQFGEYDVAWLNFIISNRRNEYNGTKYDIVEGGVANDRVIDTVEAYMSNLMPPRNCAAEPVTTPPKQPTLHP